MKQWYGIKVDEISRENVEPQKQGCYFRFNFNTLWDNYHFTIIQVDFFLFFVSCSPTNSEITNPNFHEFYDQLIRTSFTSLVCFFARLFFFSLKPIWLVKKFVIIQDSLFWNWLLDSVNKIYVFLNFSCIFFRIHVVMR